MPQGEVRQGKPCRWPGRGRRVGGKGFRVPGGLGSCRSLGEGLSGFLSMASGSAAGRGWGSPVGWTHARELPRAGGGEFLDARAFVCESGTFAGSEEGKESAGLRACAGESGTGGPCVPGDAWSLCLCEGRFPPIRFLPKRYPESVPVRGTGAWPCVQGADDPESVHDAGKGAFFRAGRFRAGPGHLTAGRICPTPIFLRR